MDLRVANLGQEIAEMAKQNTEELKVKIKNTANQFLNKILEGNENINSAKDGLTAIDEKQQGQNELLEKITEQFKSLIVKL